MSLSPVIHPALCGYEPPGFFFLWSKTVMAEKPAVPNDPVSQRVDWYVNLAHRIGWPIMILCVLAWWARPHADGLINDHRAFMRQTGEAQAQTVKTQEQQAQILQRLEGAANEHGQSLRRIEDAIRPPRFVGQN